MVDLAGFGSRLREHGRRAAISRHAQEACRRIVGGKSNGVASVPTGALRSALKVADRHRRSALDGELFEFANRKEADPLTVGREEWRPGHLQPLQTHGVQSIDRPKPQGRGGGTGAGEIDEGRAVGGDVEGAEGAACRKRRRHTDGESRYWR